MTGGGKGGVRCTWEGFSLTDFQELDNETRKIFFHESDFSFEGLKLHKIELQ